MGAFALVAGDVIGILPFINTIVTGIEGLFGHGNGTAKKQAALNSATAILGALGVVYPAAAKITPEIEQVLSRLIDDVVAAKNIFGEFKPSPNAGK